MQLRFNESQIRYYAEKYLEDHPVYDNSVKSIVGEVKARGYLTLSDLIVLSDWIKNTRNKNLIKSNCDDFVKERTFFALSEAVAEPNRVRLKGVGWSVTSAILHWFHKDNYPIWSAHTRYSVHVNIARQTPRRGEWEDYVSFCRKLAKGNGIDMRTLDRALWKYSESGGA